MKPIFIFSSICLTLLLWPMLLSNFPKYTSFILPSNCSYYSSYVSDFVLRLHHFRRFDISLEFNERQNIPNGSRHSESEIPWPIFQYPPGYNAEKYALRRATPITSLFCKLLPSEFSVDRDFSLALIAAVEFLSKINDRSRIANASLNYVLQETDSSLTFAGNLDLHKRKRYFDYYDGLKLPCGFVNHPASGFLLSEADRAAMESCRGVVVISAIFGAYDRLRQPRHVKRSTAENVCFFMFVDNATLAKLQEYHIIPNESHKIGIWRLVLVGNLPYRESVMNALIPKYLPHRLFPNCIYSIWADAKLQLVVDPLFILEKLLVSHHVDIALPKHPYNIHTIQEAVFTVRWRKWNKDGVRYQMENYCRDGLQPWTPKKLPYISDVPDTALILRRHGLQTNQFSCLLFNELHVFNPRDQLAFAYVRDSMNPKVAIHMFHTNIFNAIANEFRHYKVHRSTGGCTDSQRKRNSDLQFSSGYESACKSYLDQMWNASASLRN